MLRNLVSFVKKHFFFHKFRGIHRTARKDRWSANIARTLFLFQLLRGMRRAAVPEPKDVKDAKNM